MVAAAAAAGGFYWRESRLRSGVCGDLGWAHEHHYKPALLCTRKRDYIIIANQ